MAANHRDRGHARLRSSAIVDYLGGLSFPCSKDDILRLVVGQRAPEEIVAALEKLPDQRYSSLNDITRHFGRLI